MNSVTRSHCLGCGLRFIPRSQYFKSTSSSVTLPHDRQRTSACLHRVLQNSKPSKNVKISVSVVVAPKQDNSSNVIQFYDAIDHDLYSLLGSMLQEVDQMEIAETLSEDITTPSAIVS